MNESVINNLILLSEKLTLSKFRELHDCISLNKLIRFEIFLKDIPYISKWTEKLKLSYSVSDKSFQLVIDNSMDNWASSITDCSDTDLNAMRFVYLNANKEICEKAKQFDAKDDDFNLGLLLNYPKCCVESYLHWQKDHKDIDPITAITNSIQFTGQLRNLNFPNPFTRYFGSGFLSHFPCSLHCSETKRIANESYDRLQVNFPLIANKISHLENSFVIFHKEKGICLWNSFNSAKDKIHLDRNSFYGQGELKFIFDNVEEIEFSRLKLKLKSNYKRESFFITEGCLIETFVLMNSPKIVRYKY